MTSTVFKLVLLGCFSMLCCNFSVYAQDLSELKSSKPFSISGSIGGGASFFSSNADYKVEAPFSWNVYGNFTPSVYGISLPFSFIINQYAKSYTSPFTQFGISPSYKWMKLHLGYRNLSYSPLVFDGQSFLGGGVELTPGKFYFSAFLGRLNKAISEDTTYNRYLMPQYARHGYGFKLGYGNPNQNFSIQFFHAKDDTGSITRLHDSLTTMTPQQNTVVGSSWHFQFFKKLTFTGNIALSFLNRDMYYRHIDSISYYKVPSLINDIHPINYSSVFSYSGQATLALVLQNFNASGSYKRVAPDFQSLGIPYSIDDQEIIAATASTSLLKGRLSLSTALNTQHNNLENMLSSTLKTNNGNLAANLFVNQHLNLSANFNAVEVFQKDGLLKLSDSVKLDQLMLNLNLAPTYNFSDGANQHTISANFNYTKLDDRNPVTGPLAGCQSIATSLGYSLFFSRTYWGVNANFQYSNYNQPGNKYSSTGLNAGVNAQFLKDHNLSTQGSVGYYVNQNGDLPAGNNTTFSMNASYGVKKHSLGIYGSYILTPPVNLNPLNIVNHIPIAVNSKNFSGGITYAYQL